MQLQVEAERKKRAQILESEGIRESHVNVAEGQKRARILQSGINVSCFSYSKTKLLRNEIIISLLYSPF